MVVYPMFAMLECSMLRPIWPRECVRCRTNRNHFDNVMKLLSVRLVDVVRSGGNEATLRSIMCGGESIMKTLAGIFAAAGFALCLSAGQLRAAAARTIANVNLRASPGVSYSILNVVPRGTLVNARYCISNGWCRVEWRGSKGWISGRYLRTKGLKRRG